MDISVNVLLVQPGRASIEQFAKLIQVRVGGQNNVRMSFINVEFINAQFDVNVHGVVWFIVQLLP